MLTNILCIEKWYKWNCKTKCKKLRDEFAVLIGAETSTIEIIKPTYIKRGLEIKFHVYMNDKHMKQIDYDKVLLEANESNELAESVKIAWDLSENPKITDIHSMIVESKQQRINSIASTGTNATTNGDIEILEHRISVGSASSVQIPVENTNDKTIQ